MAECYGTRPALATYRIEGRLLAQSSKLVTASSSDGGEPGAASFREGCGTVNTDSTQDTPEAPGGDNGLEEVLARLQRETPLWRGFLAPQPRPSRRPCCSRKTGSTRAPARVQR